MKRREFIKQSTLITSALAVQDSAQAGNHIYGRPSSLPHEEGDHGARPRVGSLLISRSGLPPEYWAEACSRAELFISSALAKDDLAKDSTDDYLSVLTADNHPLHEIDDNIATLVAVNSSLFKKLIREQNYALALDIILNDHGPPGRHYHALQRRLKEVLSRGAGEIRELSGHSSRRQPISDKEVVRMMGMQHGVTEDHLALIHTLLECRLRPGEHANLLAVSVAAILVTAAAYVVVWVAVGAWVWVSGVEVIQGDNSTNRYPAQRLAQLDPTLVRKHERALTVARLTGVQGLAEASFDRLIRTETYALIGALRECAILDPDEIETEGLVDVLVMYGKKVAGLQ